MEVSLGEQRKDTITRLQRGAAVKQESDKTTHFGYREVPTREKDRLVYRVGHDFVDFLQARYHY